MTYEDFVLGVNTVLQRRLLDQFRVEAVALIRSLPDFKVPLNKFGSAYFHHYGRQLRVSNFGCLKLTELIQTLPDFLQVCNRISSALWL